MENVKKIGDIRMLTDIEIIKQSKMKNITSVISKYDILEDEI